MKIKNIMFSGAMASILMIGGAYAADGDNPKLATDAYVKSAYNAAVNKAVSNVKGGDGVSISYGTGTGAAKDATIAIDTSVIATVANMNTELATKQDALPAMTDKAGKVLKVNSQGTGLEWADDTDTNTQVELLTTTGSSTTAGMTQSAITTALGTKQDTLTAAQLLAVNSGIDATKVATYNGYADQIAAKADASALDAKANSADVYTKTQTDSAISTAVSTKANSADVYTQAAADAKFETQAAATAALALKADAETTYTKTEVDTALNGKANSADVYTKTETDAALALKADASALALKADASALTAKQDALTASNGINIDGTNNAISAKVDTSTIKFNSSGQISLAYDVTGDDFSGD